MTAASELDRIERQLAEALKRANGLGWRPVPPPLDRVGPSPVYRELERLSREQAA